jgi:hypothetical protein
MVIFHSYVKLPEGRKGRNTTDVKKNTWNVLEQLATI